MEKYIKPTMEVFNVEMDGLIATSIPIVRDEVADENYEVLSKERDMHGLWEHTTYNLWE